MAFIDLVFIPLVFIAGHFIINSVMDRHQLHSQRSFLLKLFYYHIFFSLAFSWYVTIFGGDSVGYWKPPDRFIRNDNWLSLHVPGTAFVYFLTFFFAQVLGMSFWAGSLLFSLFGFGGFICIYLTLIRTLKVNPTLFGYKLFPIILFLPNMHFWSAGVGKDTVMFFALSLFVYSITNLRSNIIGVVLSFYLAFFIRPHIAMVMVVGFGMALVLSSKGVSAFGRIAFLIISVVVFILISSTVLSFIGVEEDSIQNYEDISSIRAKNLSRRTVGSAIDISSYSIPAKIATFFYRPLFFDAGNLFGLVISMENLFFVVLTLSVFRGRSLLELVRAPVFLKACFFILFATAYFMSSSLSNLGIIIRQKNMVMFMLMLVLLYLLNQLQQHQIPKTRKILKNYAKA
jgi:hypothetical protein